MGRIDLPSGGWAEIRDPKALTERQRRPLRALTAKMLQEVQRAGFASNPEDPENEAKALSFVDAETALDLEYAGIGAFVSAWSFDFPPSADAALDLMGDDVDALSEVITPLLRQTVLKVAPSPDPDSPTGPSSASGPRSEGSPLLTLAPPGGNIASSVSA